MRLFTAKGSEDSLSYTPIFEKRSQDRMHIAGVYELLTTQLSLESSKIVFLYDGCLNIPCCTTIGCIKGNSEAQSAHTSFSRLSTPSEHAPNCQHATSTDQFRTKLISFSRMWYLASYVLISKGVPESSQIQTGLVNDSQA